MSIAVKLYKEKFIKRYDLEEHLKYFTHNDFPGLGRKDISFKSVEGNTLRGGIYGYENADKNSLVIFCHGIGGGHLSYMREIEYLCKNGFEVVGYDNTGCASSDGENIRCLAQSLSDLYSCLEYVSSVPELAGRHIYVMGHSWGGFAAGNILNYSDKVEKTVVLSGFVSVDIVMKQYFKGIIKPLRRSVMRYERKCCPMFADSSSDVGYNKTSADVLAIQSEDDPLVLMQSGIAYLKNTVKNEKVKYIVTQNKKHNPNYTVDAVKYMNECLGAVRKAVKNGEAQTVEEKKELLKNADWYRMTEQDDAVWNEIIKFLKA